MSITHSRLRMRNKPVPNNGMQRTALGDAADAGR